MIWYTIAIAVKSDKGMTILAKSKNLAPKVVESIAKPPAAEALAKAFDLASPAKLPVKIPGWVVVAHRLYGYGTAAHPVILAVSSDSPIDLSSVLMSVAGMAVLGLILVAIVGWLLGNYISRPVEELEDGLLRILNGQTNLRFEIEHDVLGGLVFRINTLLNQLMNVEEDNTDDEGRPSLAPSADAFQGGLEVDEGMEDTTLEPPLGEFSEEALDSVEPRAGGGGEVEGEALVTIKPGPDLGMLMGGVVV